MKLPRLEPSRPPANWPATSIRIVKALLLLTLLGIAGQNTFEILSRANFHEGTLIFYIYDPRGLSPLDYSGQYLSRFAQPPLYDYVTRLALGLGLDLIAFHKLLALVCWLLLLMGAAIAGMRFGGMVAILAILILFIAQPIYHFQIDSAIPHAFAFPLLIWGVVCLLYDRPYALAGLTILAGLLYAPISAVLGACLAWHFLVMRQALSPQNPRRLIDLLVIAVTAIISVALLRYVMAPVDGYGAPLSHGEKADIYPENGENRRIAIFNPLQYVFVSAFGQFRQALPPEIIIVVMLFVTVSSGYGLYRLREYPAVFRPVMAFIIPGVAFALLATFAVPHRSYRFVLYSLFAILPFLFLHGVLALCETYRSKLRYPAVAFALAMAVFVASLNSFDPARKGFILRLDPSSGRLMDFVRKLPADSLLVAWPGRNPANLIPYVAGRPLLLLYVAHNASHEGHVINMRARMFDLMNAYFATDREPLVQLRCRWQVKYMVVNSDHFDGDDTELYYFAPFEDRLNEILATTEKSEMILPHPPADAVVFQDGKFTVVDLAALTSGMACPAKS